MSIPLLLRHQLTAMTRKAVLRTAARWRAIHKMPLGSLQGLSPVCDLSLQTGDFHHSSAFYRAGFRSFHEVNYG